MSPSHRSATAPNLAEFAQSLEMCTRILKDHELLLFLLALLHILTPFYVKCWVILVHFLAQNVKKLDCDSARKSTFRMSVLGP